MSFASRSTSLTRWLTKMIGIANASRSVSIKCRISAGALVDRVQRLVHQQHAGIAEQRAADRDPLLLAPRQTSPARAPTKSQAEQRDDVVEATRLGPRAAKRAP